MEDLIVTKQTLENIKYVILCTSLSAEMREKIVCWLVVFKFNITANQAAAKQQGAMYHSC